MEIDNYSLGVKYRTIYLVYYDPVKKQNQKIEIQEDQISEYQAILEKKNMEYRVFVLTSKLEEYIPECKNESIDFGI